MCDLLAKLLHKDRNQRFASYEELRIALRKVQPVSERSGAALPRMLAWMIDFAGTFFLQLLLSLPAFVLSFFQVVQEHPFVGFCVAMLSTLSATLGLLAMAWLQSAWGSPGKKLFQLKVVDPHGLRPRMQIRLVRGLLQQPFCVSLAAIAFFNGVRLDGLSPLLFAAAFLLILVDGMLVLFGREGRTVHDRLLRTRVVVDAR